MALHPEDGNLLFKTRRSGDWILFPSSNVIYSGGPPETEYGNRFQSPKRRVSKKRQKDGERPEL
jgi:hypothetical protein